MVGCSSVTHVASGRLLHMTADAIKLLGEMLLLPCGGLWLMTRQALLPEIAYAHFRWREVMWIVAAYTRHSVAALSLTFTLRELFDVADRAQTLVPAVCKNKMRCVIGEQFSRPKLIEVFARFQNTHFTE